jgi:hypothetical protein
VFSNPVKVPHWTLSSLPNSKSSLISCACLHAFSTPSWRSICSVPAWQCSQNPQRFCLFLRTHSRILLLSTSCARSMPTRQSSTEPSARFLSALCPLPQSLPLEVFSNLKGLLLPELLISTCASVRLCLTPQSSECNSMHGHQNLNVLSHPPGVKPQRPST